MSRIVASYGIIGATILAPQKGYRNSSYAVQTDAHTLNLIIYKDEPAMHARIVRTNAVGNFLHAQGLPARRTADNRILQLKGQYQTRYAALYYYLPGQTIPWEAYTMAHLKMLGKTMSDMHAALAHFPGKTPELIPDLHALNKRMTRYFANPNVTRALSQKLGLRVQQTDFAAAITKAGALPHTQALHMDFVRGNILFDGTTITGILDFEKAAYGPRVFDIARTLAFLLVDCKYKSAAKVTKYFLKSGYDKRGALGFEDWQVLQQLLPFFLLHDFYKFLRHNPYESLNQNHHFMRTKAILFKFGVLSVE